MLFALCDSVAQAQQTAKVPRIGFLRMQLRFHCSARIDAFRQGLRELGYVEGKNIAIEYRYAEDKLERLPGLAAELVRLKVDVIVTAEANDDPSRQESDQDDSHRHGERYRSRCGSGWSTAWRGLGATSLGCQLHCAERRRANSWSYSKETVPRALPGRGPVEFDRMRATTQVWKETRPAGTGVRSCKLQYLGDDATPTILRAHSEPQRRSSAGAILVTASVRLIAT